MSLFEELKRRNVFRVGIAYVVIAWVALQGSDFVLDVIGTPDWVLRTLVLIAGIGLPVALVFAWVYEMTPEGLKRERDVDRSRSITPHTGRKLDRVIIVALAVLLVLVLIERFTVAPVPPAPEREASTGRDADEGPLGAAPKTEAATTTAATGAADADDAGPVAPEQASIAVLPFVNMSSDPEQEYFSDGLSEELLNRLVRETPLRVAARTSSFQFKGQNLDVGDIARQLNVAHVLEGSVRKSQNRLRITAQLIQADSGYHLWSETYEREMDDVFRIQDDISQAIASALEAQLGMAPATPDRRPTDDLEAYDAYLQGRYELAARGGVDDDAPLVRAVAHFERATARDPEFAEAWSGMAFAIALAPNYGKHWSATESLERTRQAAGRALALDPDNAEAHSALGYSESFVGWNWEEARAHHERAFELAPNDAGVVNLYGDFLVVTGDFDAAEQVETRAISLDPLSGIHPADLTWLYLMQHKYDEALRYGRLAARLSPNDPVRLDAEVVGLIGAGRFEEARETIDAIDARLAVPLSRGGYWEFFWCYDQGDLECAATWLERIVARREAGEYYPESVVAYHHVLLGDFDAALTWLRQALAAREPNLVWPEYFYLPERYSSRQDWLEFWKHPKLAALSAIRKANGVRRDIGWWKPLAEAGAAE